MPPTIHVELVTLLGYALTSLCIVGAQIAAGRGLRVGRGLAWVSILLALASGYLLVLSYTGEPRGWPLANMESFDEPRAGIARNSSSRTGGGGHGAGRDGHDAGAGRRAAGREHGQPGAGKAADDSAAPTRSAAAQGGRSGGTRADADTEETVGDRHARRSGLLAISFSHVERFDQPGRTFRDCPDCPEMVVVPPGFFPLGASDSDGEARVSERPRRIGRIDRAFAISAGPISLGEIGRFTAETGHALAACAPAGSHDDDRAAHCIRYDDALAYAAWLSGRTGQRYALASAAEWEHAARAGTEAPYWSGNDAAQAVGRTNPFGLRGTVSSLAEVVADCWTASLVDVPVNGAPLWRPGCRYFVLKGGAVNAPAHFAPVFARRPIARQEARAEVGFRVVRPVDRRQ